MKFRIERALLESMHLVKATGKGEWREWMYGIIFDQQGNVFATQGHIMLCGKNNIGKPDHNFILDIPKTPVDCKKYEFAEIDTDALEVVYQGSAELEYPTVGKAGIKILEWSIPTKIATMLEAPPAEPANNFVFNPGYLSIIEKIALLWEKKLTKSVYIEIRGNDRVAFVEYKAAKAEPLKLLVCPIKV